MQISPQAATVLKRLVLEGFITSSLLASPENSLAACENLLLKLLVKKGLVTEISAGRWVATEEGRAVDISNASPDAYESISNFARQGRKTKFVAKHNDVVATFQVAEHSNFGRGWMVCNIETNEIVSSSSLQDISSCTS